MKKPGRWIATFGPSKRVSRVNVEPSPALDLVEVRTVDLADSLTNVFFFDRVEAAALKEALAAALDQLEETAIAAAVAAVDPPARYRVVYLIGHQELPYGILDTTCEAILANRWRATERGAAERCVRGLNDEQPEAAKAA